MKNRTVVKVKYTQGPSRSARSRAAVNYQAHRPDPSRPGERQERQGFDKQGGLSYPQMLERASSEERFHYRLVLSPHPEHGAWMSEEDFKSYTRDLMSSLEGPSDFFSPSQRDWTAVFHPDPLHPHVHVMFYTDRLLGKEDLGELRDLGSQHSQWLAGPWIEVRQEVLQLQPSSLGQAQEGEDEDTSSKPRRLPSKDLELSR